MIRTSLHATEPGTEYRENQGAQVLGPGQLQSTRGQVRLVQLAPDTEYRVAAVAAEEAVVVLGGAVALQHQECGSSTVVRVPRGQTATLRARGAGASLFHISAPAAAEAADAAAVHVVDGMTVPAAAAHDPTRGFHHMTARLLVNGASGGTRAFTIGMSTFDPGEGCHALHRHRFAEEVFLVWHGAGVHLSAGGETTELSAGELTWVPAGEWHGFRNNGPRPVRALFCYLGVDDRAAAGYEVA